MMRAQSVDCWALARVVRLGMDEEKTQIDKFKDAARELECDDDEQRFKERLGKLTKVKAEKPE